MSAVIAYQEKIILDVASEGKIRMKTEDLIERFWEEEFSRDRMLLVLRSSAFETLKFRLPTQPVLAIVTSSIGLGRNVCLFFPRGGRT